MTQDCSKKNDALTLGAIGVLAYIIADVAHEVLGHGATCLFTGGKITLLTSVFFRNEPLSRIVAAAGPCGNVIAGALAWFLCKSQRNWSTAKRLFLVYTMAFNFFWAAGYFIYSGAADTGDWAIALGGPPLSLGGRVALVSAGLGSYFACARIIGRPLRRVTSDVSLTVTTIPYLAAGIAACVAALFSRVDTSGAIAGAFRETFLGNIVLLLLARKRRDDMAAAVVTRDDRWLITSVVLFVAFAATLGRGIVIPQ